MAVANSRKTDHGRLDVSCATSTHVVSR